MFRQTWLPISGITRTSLTGHAYTTTPDGGVFFPALATPTGELVIPERDGQPADGRGLIMPRRKRAREKDRNYRISYERGINEARIAANDIPPPF